MGNETYRRKQEKQSCRERQDQKSNVTKVRRRESGRPHDTFTILILETRNESKSVRGMPGLSEAMKDVASCDKHRGGANGLRSGDFRMGQPDI